MAAKIDQTYRAIRTQLVNGELKAGERVSEQGLAEQLGVSRSPVREAIKRLQRDGYFEQVHRIGTIVRQPGMEEVAEAYHLRAALEPYAVRNARPGAFDDCLEDLQANCDEFESIAHASVSTSDDRSRDVLVKRFFQLDEKFHEMLMRFSGNDRFRLLVGDARLFAQIHGVRRHSVITFETIMGAHRFHQRIVSSIAVGDLAEAAEHMSEHIATSRDGAMESAALPNPSAGRVGSAAPRRSEPARNFLTHLLVLVSRVDPVHDSI